MFKDQIRFYGKHAYILKKYCPDKSDSPIKFIVTDNEGHEKNVKIFETMIQCYMVAGIVGLINQKKSPVDKSSDYVANIFADVLMKPKNRVILEQMYQHMILSENDNLSPDAKVKKAFSIDKNNNDEDEQSRLEDYVRGGLEILDNYFSICKTYEDIAKTIAKFLTDYNYTDLL